MVATKTRTQAFPLKPRVFVLSDISNEPDDAESLCRYLLYSNQFQTLGLVAVTSTWLKRKTHPEDMERIIRAYGDVVDNLNAHVHPDSPYPSAESLLRLVKSGPKVYGKEALLPTTELSEGTKLLIQAITTSTDPLWILCWGGTNTLAQALQHLEKLPLSTFKGLCANLRVYAISDQDDTGAWIRLHFPQILYISSIHGWNQYGLAAWTGISGDKYYGFDKGGPDFSTMTKEWIKQHIQVGPFGEMYPDYMFIPEGDTPTFLYLIQNGLGDPEHPEWGSWGGRYIATSPDSTTRHYSDAVDRVVGASGEIFSSNHATIWRWREAFQHDFAARMQWTLSPDFSKAEHAPVVVLNGTTGMEALHISAQAGTKVMLDASASYDPDESGELTFHWYPYKDVTATQWWVDAEVATLGIEVLDQREGAVEVTLPGPEKCCIDLFTGVAKEVGQALHLVLEVRGSGSLGLRTYRRVVLQATNRELKGGRATAAESIGDVPHQVL